MKDYKIEWEACLHMCYYKEERSLSASTVTQVVFKILYAHAHTYNKNVYMNLICEYVYTGIIWEKVTCQMNIVTMSNQSISTGGYGKVKMWSGSATVNGKVS